MDVKDEDTSEQSRQEHIAYYQTLEATLVDLQDEKNQTSEPAIIIYLDKRIDAMEKDKIRIRKLFPDVRDEEWNGITD